MNENYISPESESQKNNHHLLLLGVVIIAVVLLGALAGWWFTGDPSPSLTTEDDQSPINETTAADIPDLSLGIESDIVDEVIVPAPTDNLVDLNPFSGIDFFSESYSNPFE